MKQFLTAASSAIVMTLAGLQLCHARDYVIVQDPSSIPRESVGFESAEAVLYDLNVPAGTRVVQVIALGTRCETIADMEVPKLVSDGILARKFNLASKIKSARARLASVMAHPPAGSGVLLSTVLAHLRDLALADSEVSLLIEGSPYVIHTEAPRLNLLKYYPLDGVLALRPEQSRLGMEGLVGTFRSNAITWHMPEPALEPENRTRMQRYTALAAGKAGAALINWTTDAEAASASWRLPAKFSPQRFELHPGEPAQLRPYKIVPLKCTGADPRLLKDIENLRKEGVTRCLAAAWQCDGDVDVHVDCSGQFAGEEEVFYGRTNSVHLKFLGDKTRATEKGYEICVFDEAVDPARMQCMLNLYKSTMPVRGEVVLLIDEEIRRLEFTFPADARGDAGKDRKSPNWFEVDMGRLLAQPTE